MYKKITTTTVEEYADSAPADPNKKYAPCIRLDAPLMLKLFELAQSMPDMDFEPVVSSMLDQSEQGVVLTLSDYDSLVGSSTPSNGTKA